MENGELYKLICEQVNDRIDRLEDTIHHYFDNQTIVCKDHDTRIDGHEKLLSIIVDRLEQNAKRNKTIIAIAIGLVAPVAAVINTAINFLLEKLKI